MNVTSVLARDTTPDGKELVLYVRDGVYTLRVDGLELMSSRAHGSEDALAAMACGGLDRHPKPRVLVGGLGFGFTLRSTLAKLPDNARVVVAEVFRSLIEWNRGPLADLAGRPLEDARVEVVQSDVWDLLDASRLFDAILLDVDNGPRAFTLRSNKRLYSPEGLARLAGCLAPAGRLAVWSADPSPSFERRLRAIGLAVETRAVRTRSGSGPRHTIFRGKRPRAEL